jgi:hypothetical protein
MASQHVERGAAHVGAAAQTQYNQGMKRFFPDLGQFFFKGCSG